MHRRKSKKSYGRLELVFRPARRHIVEPFGYWSKQISKFVSLSRSRVTPFRRQLDRCTRP